MLSNIVHNDEGKKNSLSNSVISEEWKAKIVESLRAAAAETGFIYASAIPGILATIGILDYLVNKKFDKLQKIVQLMNSFGEICSMAELDPSIHIMASYIRYVI